MTQENQNKLLELLEKTLKYTTIVYNQINFPKTDFGKEYILEYKQTSLATDSLLFFVPSYSCKENAKLIIRIPKVVNNQLTYEDNEYIIKVETNSGILRNTQEGDILSYRMCIFRFTSKNNLILINSPLYNEAKFSSLTVTNATFNSEPLVYNIADNTYYTLVNSKEFEQLKNRVLFLENKIIYGNDDPEEALSDKPAGTIYIKIEE